MAAFSKSLTKYLTSNIDIAQQLIKRFEEYRRTTLEDALIYYEETPPKGEFVLVIAGAPESIKEVASADDAASRVKALMDTGISRKDAIKQTAKELNLPKNVVYDAALTIETE